ncbi:cytochrome c oxidase subunit II [Orientia tsutsugamushi]|uniref:cytochrome c oxidase subunit II n=1 Tax=Orientia tsutsugamushi TaxID=784 RepID=UPI0035274C79
MLILSYNTPIYSNAPKAWQMYFQPQVTEAMSSVRGLHDFVLIILAMVVLIVLGLLIYICTKFNSKSHPKPMQFSANYKLEAIWTLIPALLLVIIAVPSFKILYNIETIPPIEMNIKVVGYQWYWHYQYPDHDNIGFNSNILDDSELKPGDLRLLEVDNRLVIPQNTWVRFIITAGDAIHSFAVPAFGTKVDAVPGRINETWIKVQKKGVYYGQCSELCGVNHGFMPIAIEVVSKEEFTDWLKTAKQKFAE